MEIVRSNYVLPHRIGNINALHQKGKKVDEKWTGRSKVVEIY
jgi:hypothetical protein